MISPSGNSRILGGNTYSNSQNQPIVHHGRSGSIDFTVVQPGEQGRDQGNQILIQPGSICFESQPKVSYSNVVPNNQNTSTPRNQLHQNIRETQVVSQRMNGPRGSEDQGVLYFDPSSQSYIRRPSPIKQESSGRSTAELSSQRSKQEPKPDFEIAGAYSSSQSQTQELLQMKEMHALLLHRECQSLAAKVVKLEKEIAMSKKNTDDKSTTTDFIPSEYSSVHHCSQDQDQLAKCKVFSLDYSFNGENGIVVGAKKDDSSRDDGTSYLLRFEIASKDRMLAELEEVKNEQQQKIGKLSAELKQLASFVQNELATYNKSIVTMREELLRMKKENHELREREQLLISKHRDVSHQTSKSITGHRLSVEINKTISEVTDIHDIDDREHSTRTNQLLKNDIITKDQILEIEAIKKAMESMKMYHEKERKEMAEENKKLQRQLNNLIETLQRPESVTMSNRPQLLTVVSKSDRYANPASSRNGAHVAHDSGFLSLSKHSADKISASSTGGIKEGSKPRVPKINTEALQGQQNLQPGEKHPLTSGGRVSYGADEDKSDSLFISQKLSEDFLMPFTDEESVEDRFAKQRIVHDILKTTPY